MSKYAPTYHQVLLRVAIDVPRDKQNKEVVLNAVSKCSCETINKI